VRDLNQHWQSDPRWENIERPYNAEDVLKLRGSLRIEHTLARHGADRLWDLLHREKCVPA
jgi:isocitrate lyase